MSRGRGKVSPARITGSRMRHMASWSSGCAGLISTGCPLLVRLDDATASAHAGFPKKPALHSICSSPRPLHDYLALNAWQLKNIKAGIAAAERGRFCQLLGILCLPSLSIDPGWGSVGLRLM